MDLEGIVQPHDFSGYSRTNFRQLHYCRLCGVSSGVETHTEHLPVVGLGTVKVGYGYCSECGHIYQTTPVPEKVLSEYYARFSNYTLNLEPCKITERLLSFAGRAQNIYEVGCGTGRHLASFRKQGANVKGCEPSRRACQTAYEAFQIVVDYGTEAECLPTVKDQDLIIFSGVLEHLPDPMGALQRAYAALAKDGLVIIEVPCATSPESLPPGWFAFEHLHYFTPDVLRSLLARAGFSIIESRVNYRDFIYPVITLVADKAKDYLSGGEGEPEASRHFIKSYMRRDEMCWAQAAKKLSEVEGDFIVWGAGIHTSQLFDRIPGLSDRVLYVMDKDPQKLGSEIAGKPVFAPDTSCKSQGHTVVISSYTNENQIFQELIAMGVPETSPIVRLYA